MLHKHGIRDRGVKPNKSIYVLKGTKMSACLLECLFVDTKADVAKLKNHSFFTDFCQAIADGIAKAVEVAPVKPATKPKEEPKMEEYKKDVLASPRFREAQKWVKETKTSDGISISDGTYPQRPVTREEVWSMLQRMSKVIG
ncbi:hypothetical protein CEW92_16445 [Bacillaceae bacterium SAS-127]|nr:hypothetical protein CEW92_16445 [Bacillaceae bacterium SAS-127]